MKHLACKHWTALGAISSRQCTRRAVKDGYCTRHHPDYISPAQAKAEAEHDAEMNKSPRQKLLERAESRRREYEEAMRASEAAQTEVYEARNRWQAAELEIRRLDYAHSAHPQPT